MSVEAAAGQVCLASAKGHRRLVLVYATSPRYVQVALAHSFQELATDKDIILPPHATGLPYILVVATDIVAPLLSKQILRCLAGGQDAPAAACWPGADLTGQLRGLPLQGRQDARWAFKLAELEVMHILGAQAFKKLLG